MTITAIRPAGSDGTGAGMADGTAGAVRDALIASPGATVALIAETAGVSRSAVSKALTGLESAGQAIRTPGTGTGRNRTGDTWQAAPAPDDDSGNQEDGDADQAPDATGIGTDPGSEAKETGPVLDLRGAMEILQGEEERRAREEADLARVQSEEQRRREEIDARLRRARTKEETRRALAELLATVTTTYAAVISDDEAAVAEGLEQISAQAVAVRRAAKAPAPARTGSGVAGGDRTPPRPLRPSVEAHLAAHPGKEFTPTEIARVLDRSSGAVANVLDKLTEKGLAELSCEKPRRFRATATATPGNVPHGDAAHGDDSATAGGDGTDAPAGR